MENLKVENIQRVYLNGVASKLFDVYELTEGSWVFVGRFEAPAKTATQNLLQHYINNVE